MEEQEKKHPEDDLLNELKAQTKIMEQLKQQNVLMNNKVLSIQRNVRFFALIIILSLVFYLVVALLFLLFRSAYAF
jgi:hypothetical protein